MKRKAGKRRHILLFIFWIALLAFFFAQVEIQIEGCHGWASALPTWRIDRHPLLDIFWGGRPMTGYHAWVVSFMFLAFHLPQVACNSFTFRLEARSLGSLMLFWIVEDLLWFLLNPAYGPARFAPAFIPWHKHWRMGVPTDYLTFTVVGAALLWWSFRDRSSGDSDLP